MHVSSFTTRSAQDMHTDKYGILAADRSQDYILDDVYGKRDGRIAFVFHRQYDTCDTDDYLIDVSRTFMFAVHCGMHSTRHYCAFHVMSVYCC